MKPVEGEEDTGVAITVINAASIKMVVLKAETRARTGVVAEAAAEGTGAAAATTAANRHLKRRLNRPRTMKQT